MSKLLIVVVLLGAARLTIAQSFDVAVESPFRGKNRMTISLRSGNYIVVGYDSLPDLIRFRNIDSLLTIFAKHYVQVADSATYSETDASYIRYSFNLEQGSQYLTIRRYPARETHYRFKAGTDPVELKQLQDTLLIRLSVKRSDRKTFIRKTFDLKDMELVSEYFHRTTSFYVVVNRITDIIEGKIAPINPLLAQAIGKIEAYPKYNLLSNPSIISSVRMAADSEKVSIQVYKKYRPVIQAFAPLGLAFIGGTWAGSFQYGFIVRPRVEFDNRGVRVGKNGYGFLLQSEGNFFFDKLIDKGVAIQIGQFINVGMVAFRPRLNRKNIYDKPVDEAYIQLKAGFLVGSSGPYYDARTFRLSGVYYVSRNIFVEPEFYYGKTKSYPGFRVAVQL